MNHETFKQLLESRIEKTKAVLDRKASEYSTDDRLHNFKAAAAMSDCTPQKALWGMLAKHLVSVFDIVNAQVSVSPELLDEKIGDSINYLILLEAILKENNTVPQAEGTFELAKSMHAYNFPPDKQGALSNEEFMAKHQQPQDYFISTSSEVKIRFSQITRVGRFVCPLRFVAYVNQKTKNLKANVDYFYILEEDYDRILKLSHDGFIQVGQV